MSYTSVIYGAGGAMGEATVFNEIIFSKAAAVRVVDPRFDPDRFGWDSVGDIQRRFDALLGSENYKKLSFFTRSSSLTWEGADVAISCAPHGANVELTKGALQYGVPYCDLGGCGAVVEEQRRIADGADTLIGPECGLAPGAAGIYAARLAKHYGCKEIKVRCGGNPATRPDPKENPLLYKLVYSPEGLASGFADYCTEIEGGEFVNVPALSTVERFDDEFESTPTSHNSHFVVEYLRSLGVRSFSYQTLRYHGHCAALKSLDGFENPVLLAKRLRSMPELRFDRRRDRDRITFVAAGERGKTFRYDIYSDPITQFTAMEITTAAAISLVAQYIATKGAPKGFATPEQFIDGAWFISEFERRIDHFNVL